MEEQKEPYLTPYRDEIGDCLDQNNCQAVHKIVQSLGDLLFCVHIVFQKMLLEP